jgi:hypothetical protein
MINEIVLSELSVEDSMDFKDCLFQEIYITGDLKYKNLKKWIRYAAIDYGDADQILKTNVNITLLREKLEWEDSKYIDCIFSFRTFFNAFLRLYFNDSIPHYGELMDNFDLLFCDSKLREFQSKHKLSKEEFEEFLTQLDTFSKKTHTLGNYMPCPDMSYNGKKGSGDGYVLFQDRIELLYDALFSDKYNDECAKYLGDGIKEKWKEWFGQNEEKLCLNEIISNREKLMEFKCPSKKRGRYTIFAMNGRENMIAYTKYLSVVNKLIDNRTNKMIRMLE